MVVTIGWRGWSTASLVTAVSLLTAACGGAGSRPLTTGSTPPCATSAVHIGLGPHVGMYTAHVVRSLVFVNRSGAACTLEGYPAVSFVTAPDGPQVGPAARRLRAPVRPVLLAPGGRASAVLLLTSVFAFGTACSPRWAWGLLVVPPNQSRGSHMHLVAQACSGPGPVFAYVGPVRAGRPAR